MPPKITYPEGMTEKLAGELYGEVRVPWAQGVFEFKPERSECRAWLEHCSLGIQKGDSYQFGIWPRLVDVIRRHDKTHIRVFQWSNGFVFEQDMDAD